MLGVLYGINGGRRIVFHWHDEARYIFPGGPSQLRLALGDLAALGWVRLEEDADTGRCIVTPTSQPVDERTATSAIPGA